MSARNKVSNRRSKKKAGSRKSPREAFEANLKSLERQLPAGLARGVRELRKNMKDLERQIDKARAEREARWHKLETQIRKDAARALRRLEHAIEPPKRAQRKAAAKKKSGRKRAAANQTN